MTIMVDPWRNDPSGAWGLWYRMDFPVVDVDIGMSTHAHFDHDALDRVDANMLLDRMAGSFQLGDVKITAIADKHQCVAPGIVAWTEAVKQFEGRPGSLSTDQLPPHGQLALRDRDRRSQAPDVGRQPARTRRRRSGTGSVEVDIVFVPVDGSRHILDYTQADAVVVKTGAKAAIPHHYLVPETTFYTSTLLPATEWAETHEHTMLDNAEIELSAADLEGKSGHVYYFGSNNKVTEGQ